MARRLPHTTGTYVAQGYEARYLIKNSQGQYYSIACTGQYIFHEVEGGGSGGS